MTAYHQSHRPPTFISTIPGMVPPPGFSHRRRLWPPYQPFPRYTTGNFRGLIFGGVTKNFEQALPPAKLFHHTTTWWSIAAALGVSGARLYGVVIAHIGVVDCGTSQCLVHSPSCMNDDGNIHTLIFANIRYYL